MFILWLVSLTSAFWSKFICRTFLFPLCLLRGKLRSPFIATIRNLITYVTLNLTMESDQSNEGFFWIKSSEILLSSKLFHACRKAHSFPTETPQTRNWCYVFWLLVCFYIEWFYSWQNQKTDYFIAARDSSNKSLSLSFLNVTISYEHRRCFFLYSFF